MLAEKRNWRSHVSYARWAAIIIMVVATVWQCIGAWTDSQTTDEAVHLTAGYSYWRTNDHRLNPEHPVLFKLWASWPLLVFPHINFSTSDPSWLEPNQWNAGSNLVNDTFENIGGIKLILFAGRLPMVAIWAMLGYLLWRWANKRWGEWSGVMALGLYAFDPTLLGHGHLITNDLAMSLVFVGVLMLLEKFFSRPSASSLAWLTIVFVLAQLTKFSAVILWLIVPLLGLIWLLKQRPIPGRWWWRMVISFVVAVPIGIWLTYGFEVQRFDSEQRLARAITESSTITDKSQLASKEMLTQWFYKYGNPATPTGRLFQNLRYLQVPAYHYFVGLVDTYNHNYFGHTAFLLGQVRVQGWWYYFPVALAAKMPIITMIMLIMALIGALNLWPRPRFALKNLPMSWWLFYAAPVVYLLWSMTSHINIGLRHVFPFMVFLPLWASGLLAHPWFTARRAMLTALGATSIIAITAGLAGSHTLAYFNGFFGGTRNGQTILQDSNLDWNQDTWRLRAYIDRRGLTDYALAIPGGRQEAFFPEARSVLTDQAIAAGQQPRGIIIITAAVLYDQNNSFHWLWDKKPTEIIGSVVYRFDFN